MTSASPLGSRAPLGGARWKSLLNVVVVDSASSTNDVARLVVERMVAEDSEILPTALFARRQTAGKGRHGRAWTSAGPNPLSVSLVVPWPEGPGRVKVPVAWGIRVARGLSARYGIDVRLKWPNDLLVGRRKLGGLLVEARVAPEGAGYAVVGIGLNVDATQADLAAAGVPEATSLLVAGAEASLLAGERPLRTLLDILDDGIRADDREPSDVTDIPAAFGEVTAHAPGDPLEVHDGASRISGAYAGVTGEGFLRLETGGGIEVVLSGDVTLF